VKTSWLPHGDCDAGFVFSPERVRYESPGRSPGDLASKVQSPERARRGVAVVQPGAEDRAAASGRNGAAVRLAPAAAEELARLGEPGADGRRVGGASEVRSARVPVGRRRVAAEDGEAIGVGIHPSPPRTPPKETLSVRGSDDGKRRNGLIPSLFLSCQKLRGHAGYYGIVGNSPALARFYHEVLKVWRKWLSRRRRAWRGSWDWFNRLKQRYPVPYLRVIHTVRRGVANG